MKPSSCVSSTNILFTAAYSPDGLSAFLVELGAAGRVTLLTSPLAIVEAERNLEAKRPAALGTLRRTLPRFASSESRRRPTSSG